MGKCAAFAGEGAYLSPDRPRYPFVRSWREALPAGGAGTERYLTRFLVRPEYMGTHEREQQPLAKQRARTVAHTPEKARPLASKLKRIYAPRLYLRPHSFPTAFQTPTPHPTSYR